MSLESFNKTPNQHKDVLEKIYPTELNKTQDEEVLEWFKEKADHMMQPFVEPPQVVEKIASLLAVEKGKFSKELLNTIKQNIETRNKRKEYWLLGEQKTKEEILDFVRNTGNHDAEVESEYEAEDTWWMGEYIFTSSFTYYGDDPNSPTIDEWNDAGLQKALTKWLSYINTL